MPLSPTRSGRHRKSFDAASSCASVSSAQSSGSATTSSSSSVPAIRIPIDRLVDRQELPLLACGPIAISSSSIWRKEYHNHYDPPLGNARRASSPAGLLSPVPHPGTPRPFADMFQSDDHGPSDLSPEDVGGSRRGSRAAEGPSPALGKTFVVEMTTKAGHAVEPRIELAASSPTAGPWKRIRSWSMKVVRSAK